MAYSEKLADQIRHRLAGLPHIEEKKMMGGLTFMYNGKMCVGIIKDDLMCRIDPALHETAISKKGCRTLDFTTRPMSGFILVDESGRRTQQEFDYWIDMALDFNKKAKASKKASTKKAAPKKSAPKKSASKKAPRKR